MRSLVGGCYSAEVRTQKQMDTARMNGNKSRGPITAMGKDRVRSNALKHGLTARLVLWKNEDPAVFQAVLTSYLDELAPQNDLEFLCVEEMAMAKWRQRRVLSIEAAAGNRQLKATEKVGSDGTLDAFTEAQKEAQLLMTLRQHEAAYGRAYQRAYQHFLKLRANGRGVQAHAAGSSAPGEGAR